MADNRIDPNQVQREARQSVVSSLAIDVMQGQQVGITIDTADQIGLGPKIHQDGAWGVTAEAIFELDTEVHTTVEVFTEQAAQDLRDRRTGRKGAEGRNGWESHVPSGYGLRRTGTSTSEGPLYSPRRSAER